MKKSLMFIALLMFVGHLTAMNENSQDQNNFKPFNLYKVFNLESDATPFEIEKAYLQTQGVEQLSQEQQTFISVAYSILMEPALRRKYDQQGCTAAINCYYAVAMKRTTIIQKEQEKINDLFKDKSITSKEITKKIIDTNTQYLKLAALRKDPTYRLFLNEAINTNIYHLAMYLYKKNNFFKAYKILNQHMTIATKESSLYSLMENLKGVCYQKHSLSKQNSRISFNSDCSHYKL